MTTTPAGQGAGAQEQVFVNRYQTIIDPPQYASVQPMPNYAVTGGHSEWPVWKGIAVVVAILAVAASAYGVSQNFSGMTKWGNCDPAVCKTLHEKEIQATTDIVKDTNQTAVKIAATNAKVDIETAQAVQNILTSIPKIEVLVPPAPEVKVIYVTPPAPVYKPAAAVSGQTCTREQSLASTPYPEGKKAVPRWNPRRNCCDWWVIG